MLTKYNHPIDYELYIYIYIYAILFFVKYVLVLFWVIEFQCCRV